MRYHYEKPTIYLSMYGKRYICDHPVYDSCTLFEIGDKGLAVIQQRYDAETKSTFWTEVDAWLTDALYVHRSVIQEAMEDDRESMRSCYDMYNRVMDSLEKMLDNDDLTFEQKTYILDQMQEVAAAVADKDSEKSRNRLKLIGVIGGVAAAIVAALASSLGGNIALKESNNIDDDNITDL